MVLAFLIILFGFSGERLSDDWNEISVVSHFRPKDISYPTMRHALDDDLSTNSITRAINRSEDAGCFCIVLSRELFQAVPKWNGKLSDLPVSEERAIQLFKDSNELFVEKDRWSLEGVALLSVGEQEGDYVWMGYFEYEVRGKSSHLPRTVVYLKMDEEFIAPQPIKDERADCLKKTFKENFLKRPPIHNPNNDTSSASDDPPVR
jgi:hypothetical protein